MEDILTFTLTRVDEGKRERIEVVLDHGDMDIHDVFKAFGEFLISVSYAPEAIQKGADEFDIERI